MEAKVGGGITEYQVLEKNDSASAIKLSNIQKQAKEYEASYISIENLETLLLQTPQRQVLSQKLESTQERNILRRWWQRTKYFVNDNWQRIWVMTLWVVIMLGLFVYQFMQYKNRVVYESMGNCICTAKGAAETLKFNMALILLPICRNTITWIRNRTKLRAMVPLDDHLNFHKVIALGIAIGIVLHGGSHLVCDFPRVIHATEEEYGPMKRFFGDEQPQNYWWFLKGVAVVTGITMVALMVIAFTLASPWFRRNKLNFPKPINRLIGFNAFWYSHHLFVVVYALLVVHGTYLNLTKIWYQKTTWMYLAVPVALYAGERLIRALRSTIQSVKILKVDSYGNVLKLHLSKPHGFTYKSGQYVFINCPAVSSLEWHPFSITSSPGDDYISIHIQTIGDWTQQLMTLFTEEGQPLDVRLRSYSNGTQGVDNSCFPKILVDGPYGAPAQDYRNYKVVLLVGLGIGATPMISIIKDILDNIKFNPDEDQVQEKEDLGVETALESGKKANSNSTPNNHNGDIYSKKKRYNTQRAYFYWVTREQASFQWFKGIMKEVAEMDSNRVIEMHNYCTSGVMEKHNYCTSVYKEGDATLYHAKNGLDIVSGNNVKFHFARPKWQQVFTDITIDHPDSHIGVFYCGPPALAKELRELALKFSHKTNTKFDFRKENF